MTGNTETAQTGPTPSAEQLASMVLIGPFDNALDHWESSRGCVAWLDGPDRRCGKDAPGYLCTLHQKTAERRWERHVAKAAARADKARQDRARDLPRWRAELERLEAEIRRLDPPPATTDLAAYGGDMHASLRRARANHLSDDRVAKLANLHRKADRLRRQIGND